MTETKYTEQQLRVLGEDGLRQHAKELKISLRGRPPSEETLMKKILAAYEQPNGNGAAGPKLAEDTAGNEVDGAVTVDKNMNKEVSDTTSTTATSTEKKKDIAVEIMTESDAKPFLEDIKRLVDECHPHLEGARFLLCWKYNFRKADDTNRMKFGAIDKASEINREIAEKGDLGRIDWIVYMNYQEFGKGEPTPALRLGELDFLLESCKPVEVDGKQKRDTADRKLWRKEKPLEVYPAVIQRRGFTRRDLLEIGEACSKHKIQTSMFD